MKRRHLPLVAAALAAALMVAAAIWSRVTGPVTPPAQTTVAPVTGAGPDATPSQPAAKTPESGANSETAGGDTPAGRSADPLPPLVPGNPLTDERFAAISARIVIASVGLKKEKDWESLVVEYMDQELAKERLTADQYNEYAQALYANPDRGRAMAENIMRRVEEKLGTRVDMKALPMFGMDPAELEKLQQKLKE